MPRLAAGGQQKPVEEKITINLGVVDLGRIDLLVREGFYANRTDLIRTAIRHELKRHDSVVDETTDRQSLVLGLRRVTRAELEALRTENRRVDLHVLGLLELADDIDAALARDTIASVMVLGTMKAAKPLREALADRLR